MSELKKALADRMLDAEMDHHLESEAASGPATADSKAPRNHRNGYSKKRVLTENSQVDLAIPRDRQGTFEPQLIAKYQRRFPGFDDKIISMYARGLSVREIQGHLHDLYGMEVSPQLISTVTDAVLEEVGKWQGRPLEPLYAFVFFDAIRVKIRDSYQSDCYHAMLLFDINESNTIGLRYSQSSSDNLEEDRESVRLHWQHNF